MDITYIGHAAIMMHSGGKTLLMDPWLHDPTYHGTWWHYPPLETRVEDLPKVDYLYISHEHPDHFDPPTLERLDKDVEVVIARFEKRRFRQRLDEIGFRNITELPYNEDYRPDGGNLVLRLIAPDRAWDDSAIVVRDDENCILNVNDCHLSEATLAEIGRNYSIDLAFLTFTGASQYPNCFDFSDDERRKRSIDSKKSHVQEFVNWAKLLRTKRAVPAAGNFALLGPDQYFMNDSSYANSPGDAIEALAAGAPDIEGLQMNPGDRWSEEGGHVRLKEAPDWSRRLEDIAELTAARRKDLEEYLENEPAAAPGLFERFRTYFNGLIEADPDAAREIAIVVWWQLDGPQGGDWYIDFSRDGDWVQHGVPSDWNLRIQMPDKLVDLGVSGKAIWDNIVLSFRPRLSRRPDKYMKAFWTWFSKI